MASASAGTLARVSVRSRLTAAATVAGFFGPLAVALILLGPLARLPLLCPGSDGDCVASQAATRTLLVVLGCAAAVAGALLVVLALAGRTELVRRIAWWHPHRGR